MLARYTMRRNFKKTLQMLRILELEEVLVHVFSDESLIGAGTLLLHTFNELSWSRNFTGDRSLDRSNPWRGSGQASSSTAQSSFQLPFHEIFDRIFGSVIFFSRFD